MVNRFDYSTFLNDSELFNSQTLAKVNSKYLNPIQTTLDSLSFVMFLSLEDFQVIEHVEQVYHLSRYGEDTVLTINLLDSLNVQINYSLRFNT